MIELLAYTSKWKDNFNQLRHQLFSLSNDLFLEIAHIGSTAIISAPAKDIVDIQCGIESFDKMDQIKSILEPLGFAYNESIQRDHVPFYPADYVDAAWEKRIFSGVWNGQQFHIHIRRHLSLNWKFAIQFRDFMIANPKACFAYMQFKERLASTEMNPGSYCMIKDSVIDLVSLQFFEPVKL